MSDGRNQYKTTLGTGPGWIAVLCLAVLAFAGLGEAQLPPAGAASQFDITGFLQEAAVTDPANSHSGGTLKVNGQVVTVPAETIVILPANALTWQELFAKAPLPWGLVANGGNGQSGLAMTDCANATVPCTAPPLTTYEVHVVGNVVAGQYIAGLINISQQGLNSGAGFINYIDYTLGELRVGGAIGDPTTGNRIRINDPVGRYGRATTSPDVRFTVDPDNPTIMSATGYPMCLPRSAPDTDPNCPQGNRPITGVDPVSGATIYAVDITTNNLTNPQFPINTGFPNSTFQAPFEIGDYITFAGTLVKDCPVTGCVAGDGPTVGPMPALGTAATYISAHTIVNNVAIYTWPGSNPAYTMTEVTIIGTGGLTVLGAGEAAVRTRFEGMMTDPSRLIHLYGIDLDPATGAVTDRDWGMIGVDPGPANGGAVKGRWRFRPPCTAVGLPTQKTCTPPPAGTFLPPTREVRSVIVDAATGRVPANTGFAGTAANGLIWGQYHAPILEYIFPENIPGTPIVENNFNTIDFLVKGGYCSSGIPDGVNTCPVGQLNPWPGSAIPTPTCTPPVAHAGGPYTVASGGTVTLAGSATGSTPLTFAWAPPALGSLDNLAVAGPVYTAPPAGVNTSVALSLTVTNACGSSTSGATLTINAATGPTVSHVPAQTVLSGTPVTLNISATDPALPPGQSLNFTVLQVAGPAPNVAPLVVTQVSPTSATATFTYALPLGGASVTLTFRITATDPATGLSSAAEFTSVTVNPLPDTVVITAAEFRTGKVRLTITATSSVISPLVNLILAPYVTINGTTYNPDPAQGGLGNVFTNNGGGLYTLDLVGAPEPAIPPARPLTVTSSLGGVSAPSALTRIR